MKGRNWSIAFVTTPLIIILIVVTPSFFLADKYPLVITNRVSLDAKIDFLRKTNSLENAEILIVGSSMGLNNIAGELLQNNTGKKVANISAWGLTPANIEDFLGVIPATNHIDTILYAAFVQDFTGGLDLDFEMSRLQDYLTGSGVFWAYARNAMNIKSYWLNAYRWSELHLNKSEYKNLLFDKTGSVPFDIYGKDINQKRWSQTPRVETEKKHFDALRRMAEKFRIRNVKFIFVIVPIRQKALESSREIREAVENFASTTKIIVENNGGIFLNYVGDQSFDDSYFVDFAHQNRKGMTKLTNLISEEASVKGEGAQIIR